MRLNSACADTLIRCLNNSFSVHLDGLGNNVLKISLSRFNFSFLVGASVGKQKFRFRHSLIHVY